MYGVALHHPDPNSIVCKRMEALLRSTFFEIVKVTLPGHLVFYHIGFTLSVSTGTHKLGSAIPEVDEENWNLVWKQEMLKIPQVAQMVRERGLEPKLQVIATAYSSVPLSPATVPSPSRTGEEEEAFASPTPSAIVEVMLPSSL